LQPQAKRTKIIAISTFLMTGGRYMDYSVWSAVTHYYQLLEVYFNYDHVNRLGVSIAIFSFFWLLRYKFTKYILYVLVKICNTKATANEYLIAAFKCPLVNTIVALGTYLALRNYFPLTYEHLLDRLLSSFIVLFMAHGVHTLVKLYGNNVEELGNLLDINVDKILIPFFSKMIRFLILALAFVTICSNWGYDINGFIAGLGLGGLAFALAAKDLLANIFSGMVIIADRPFSIGDWIKTSDLEGTIADINFRSTKIRTFEHALVTVPNSNLINAPIINFTKREMRRITFNLGVTYDTPSYALKKCVDKIQYMLVQHPSIDNKTIFVKFDSFGESGLNIFMYFFTRTTIWEEYLNIKQDVNFQILKILEEENVRIAFPRTSHYFETPLQIVNPAQAIVPKE
jgi:MscS family membrane protein